ncbi:MAG TPA: alanine racemase [Dictyoglomaceae bacterium]|nr:alanine racemase [Dictyoglomaceae bacterium]HOL39139.1 alanine racemase [Dictyoglomaceae bacterium]HOP94252.1 alanine racemase [Dictyoglomaceae bacterium]HPP15293.1 alanine racemase [Dictyoglomaceae bacterium]HPU42699.1 alanine racemase [Dictyoglomaceae bacterium]
MEEKLAWKEINLSALLHNLRLIQAMIGSKTDVIAVVKADAYGHGVKVVSRFLQKFGVKKFAVAYVDEGIELREIGIEGDVIILSPQLKDAIPYLFEYNLTPVVSDIDFLRELGKYSQRKERNIKFHLGIDTGMGREGLVPPFNIEEIKNALINFKTLHLEAITSHLSSPEDKEDPYNLFQKRIFEEVRLRFREEKDIFSHLLNTGGIFNFSDFHYQGVRPGISLYGYGNEKLQPVMEVKARVTLVKELPSNWGIGYGHTFITEFPTRIALIPIGYADGYRRELSNKGRVLIKGKYHRVLGRISMDQFTVDINDEEVQVGDIVIVMGEDSENKIDAQWIATVCSTIPYEILTGFGSSKRLKNFYKFEGKILKDPIGELNL